MFGEILTPLNIYFLGTTKSETMNVNSEPKQNVLNFSYLLLKKSGNNKKTASPHYYDEKFRIG
jgi:hypothetical protein